MAVAVRRSAQIVEIGVTKTRYAGCAGGVAGASEIDIGGADRSFGNA